jgi:hypothetical protein
VFQFQLIKPLYINPTNALEKLTYNIYYLFSYIIKAVNLYPFIYYINVLYIPLKYYLLNLFNFNNSLATLKVIKVNSVLKVNKVFN